MDRISEIWQRTSGVKVIRQVLESGDFCTSPRKGIFQNYTSRSNLTGKRTNS